LTTPSSVGALYRRGEAVAFASQRGQSTGALLIAAGGAASGLGHPRRRPGRAGRLYPWGIQQAQPKRHGEE